MVSLTRSDGMQVVVEESGPEVTVTYEVDDLPTCSHRGLPVAQARFIRRLLARAHRERLHAYAPVNDPEFLGTVEAWFGNQTELLVLIRFHAAAGARDFRLFTSFAEFQEHLTQLPHLACVIVFRDPQLPLRGTVDDAFIARCLQEIPEGSEYLMLELELTVLGRCRWFHYEEGESHAELRESLEQSRGKPVAAGLYPPWLYDNEDLISAVVPDEHGVARSGIY